MNIWLKITIAGFIAGLFLIFFILYELERDKKALTGDEEIKKESVQVEHVEVKNLLLPLENSKKRTTPISHVMLHFTSNITENPQNPYHLDDIYDIFTEYGVSAHYMIDRNGLIYMLVPENRVAFHTGAGSLPNFPAYENNLNDYSIGIELLGIGTKEEMAAFINEDTYNSLNPSLIGYTDAQYEALRSLLNTIYERHPEIKRNREHVIGHDEYAPERKSDPGVLFDWSRIGY